MLPSEQRLLDEIDDLLHLQLEQIAIPHTKINAAIADLVGKNALTVNKLISKVLKGIDKRLTKQNDHVDSVATAVLQGADQWLFNQEWMLQQLSVKGGLISAGQPIDYSLLTDTEKSAEVQYIGTLLLAVREAVPWLERIATAGESIAGSLKQLVLRFAPTQAEALAEEVPSTQKFPIDDSWAQAVKDAETESTPGTYLPTDTGDESSDDEQPPDDVGDNV